MTSDRQEILKRKILTIKLFKCKDCIVTEVNILQNIDKCYLTHPEYSNFNINKCPMKSYKI